MREAILKFLNSISKKTDPLELRTNTSSWSNSKSREWS